MPPNEYLIFPLDWLFSSEILGMLFEHLEKVSLFCFDHKPGMGTGIYHLVNPARDAVPCWGIQSRIFPGNMDFFRPEGHLYMITDL